MIQDRLVAWGQIMIKKQLIQKIMVVGIVLVTVFTISYGENISISGTVKNKKTGAPVTGVLVTLEGTTFLTATGESGQFSIKWYLLGTFQC